MDEQLNAGEKKKTEEKKKKINLKPAAGSVKKVDVRWVVTIIIWTFVLSITAGFSSQELISGVSLFWAFVILIVIILIGIIFDIIGIGVATADEQPFHSLAARKFKAAREAIALIKNAEKVSNFCNDVVGDICGVVSGATGAIIVESIASHYEMNVLVLSLIVTAFIAAFTVGGKAIGKSFAMTKSNSIVYMVANIAHASKSFLQFLFFWRKKEK